MRATHAPFTLMRLRLARSPLDSGCKALQTPRSETAKRVDGDARRMRTWRSPIGVLSMQTNTNSIQEGAPQTAIDDLQIGAEQSARLIRVFAESLRVRRHYQLFLWLQGELQAFVPHQVLVSAWGDFANWNLKLDVVSGLPGVRTEQLAHCRIDSLLRQLFAIWVAGGREPAIVRAADVLGSIGNCSCPVHAALRGLHSLLVHGVRDERGGYDSLYVAMHSRAFGNGRPLDHDLALVDLLIPQIDVAFRRVAAFKFSADAGHARICDRGDLSSREQEVLEWICQGKANADIGAGLGISTFTVKNHLRSIFRKLGVRSRFEAAHKYSQAFSEARRYFES